MSEKWIPTASGTVGPFFPPRFLGEADNDLTVVVPHQQAISSASTVGASSATSASSASSATSLPAPPAQGERIHVSGHVYEAGRVPRFNTIVEIWQADAGGRFAHAADPRHAQADPHFMGWGRTWTDKAGYFEFTTVKPGAYLDPVSGRQRAPHINISFTGSGLMRRLVTTLFFPGDARNAVDPVLAVIADAAWRTRLILKAASTPRAAASMAGYLIDITLQGAGETPFFID